MTAETDSIVPAVLERYSFLNRPKIPFVRAKSSPTAIRSPSCLSRLALTSPGEIERTLARLSGVTSPGMNVCGDDLLGVDAVAHFDQHVPRDRQHAPHAVPNLADDLQSGSVRGHYGYRSRALTHSVNI